MLFWVLRQIVDDSVWPRSVSDLRFCIIGAAVKTVARSVRISDALSAPQRRFGALKVPTAAQAVTFRHSLEPISKSSEEDNEACELDKAEEVLSVVLPADEYATLPLYPGEEALDEPAPLVTA